MISCDEKALYFEPVKWVFELIEKAYDIDVIGNIGFNVKIGIEKSDQLRLSKNFYDTLINHKNFGFKNHFDKLPIVLTEDGEPDYISSIFYLVNGFQEYDLLQNQKDKYGRLDFKKSLQFHFNIIEKDLVKEYVKKLLKQIDTSLKLPESKSRIFISHDIDSVYGSLKYDGLAALKKGNIFKMLKVIFQTVLLNPPWFNIDKIAKLEDAYDVKACYYWIVQNGRCSQGIKNGDYKFSSSRIQNQLNEVRLFGNEIGLHKSTMSTGFQDELATIPQAKTNRYHFLKIDNPHSFREMEDSNIFSDSSIGFPYTMGFKNSFGMPYQPFDLDENRKLNVLEIPLQIMDGMFDIQKKDHMAPAYKSIINFIENNNTDAIISILWHNSEMTNFAYEWSFKCYQKLLQYFVDEQFETVLPSQLVKEYEIA